jgi:iron(III) transport system ATP-binding protein
MNRCRTLTPSCAKRRGFLRELIVKLGLSALMVTHDQNEAMAISDRILLLNNGVIEQQGTPQEIR